MGRLETPDETAARIAAYDFPRELADSVPREPWITTRADQRGAGPRVRPRPLPAPRRDGARHGSPAGRRTRTAWRAARRTGCTFPFDYDRRHAATVVANLRLGAKLSLSATARLGTGFPRTPVDRLRVHGVPDAADRDRDGNREELVPERDAEGRLVYTTDLGGLAKLNSARLPHYERLDLRLTWMPRGPQGRVTALPGRHQRPQPQERGHARFASGVRPHVRPAATGRGTLGVAALPPIVRGACEPVLVRGTAGVLFDEPSLARTPYGRTRPRFFSRRRDLSGGRLRQEWPAASSRTAGLRGEALDPRSMLSRRFALPAPQVVDVERQAPDRVDRHQHRRAAVSRRHGRVMG